MVSYEKENNFCELVRKAKQGDKSSLDRLAEVAESRLKSHFLRITLDFDLAGDLTQETMLRMIKYLERLENVRRFWPWLFRIAANITNDHYRGKKRGMVTRFSSMEDGSLQEVLRDDSCRPEKPIFRQEACFLLNNAVSALKKKHREIVTMRCFDGLSYAQIGDNCGCSEISVRTTLSRAKKNIREYLLNQGVNSF